MLFTYIQQPNQISNEFEERNYTQILLTQIKMLKVARNRAFRLSNAKLNKAMDDSVKFSKSLISTLQKYHFEEFASNDMKKAAIEEINKAPSKLEALCENIRKELNSTSK